MGNLDLKGSDLQHRTYQGDRPAQLFSPRRPDEDEQGKGWRRWSR